MTGRSPASRAATNSSAGCCSPTSRGRRRARPSTICGGSGCSASCCSPAIARRVARRIADQLDIAEVRAEALPAQKMTYVLDEVAAGYRPLVVGDGINDALALKAGAVGIAMGAQGTDVALASADLVLMTNDLRRLGTCIRLSRRCRRTIYVNVAVGLGWTVVIVGLRRDRRPRRQRRAHRGPAAQCQHLAGDGQCRPAAEISGTRDVERGISD